MKIGFDLDRIFIDNPPFIPRKLIDLLYKDLNSQTLSYRIPASFIEQWIRKLAHLTFLRPKIQNNINFLHQLSHNYHTVSLYLISSRYHFLKNTTFKILKKYQLDEPFKEIFLNIQNEQPHLFKEKVIKQLRLDLYIDDDLDLLRHLYTTCPKTKLFWYNPYGKKRLHNGIMEIQDLNEVKNYAHF